MRQIRLTASIRIHRALLIASTLTAVFTTPLASQSIAPGTPVRITPRDSANRKYEGTFLKSSRDSILFVSRKTRSAQSFPLELAGIIEQSTHYKRRGPRAAAGAGIGFAGMALAFTVLAKSSACERCDSFPVTPELLLGSALVIGAPIGAAVGAISGGEDWKPVSQPLAVGAVQQHARIQLLSFKF